VGKASVLKLCLNQFMGMMTATLSGSVNVLQAEGLDVDLLMGILRQFPYYAPTFDTKLPRMRDHDYSKPSFTCRLMMKDIRLAAEEARRNGVSNILLEGLTSLFREAVDRGYGDSDYSAVHEAVRRLDR
jgi:3-hydroxyisobutyrate dehydrogenase